MIFDSYSLYQKKLETKTGYRLVRCSANYEPLHRACKRSPEVPLYISAVPDSVHCHNHRKPALSLTGAGGTYLTGLYIPDPARPDLAYGDLSEDAVLFLSGTNQAELFIAKGKKVVAAQLYQMIADYDADLWDEMEEHRQKAKCITNKGVSEDTSCPPSAT